MFRRSSVVTKGGETLSSSSAPPPLENEAVNVGLGYLEVYLLLVISIHGHTEALAIGQPSRGTPSHFVGRVSQVSFQSISQLTVSNQHAGISVPLPSFSFE